MATLPGKKPLIRLSDRGPNYEAPLEYFRTPITPNDEFFIRYHLSNIPEVDAKTYKIEIGGDGANGQTELTLDDLKKMPAVELVAVNQCSATPACPIRMSPASNGVTAPWAARAGKASASRTCSIWSASKPEAIEIAFNGADSPIFDKTPDFIKSLPVWKATDELTLIAYEMNGGPLPHFNGYPTRLAGARLDRHLLDEAPRLDHRLDQTAGRLLDEPGLPHPDRQIPVDGALHLAGIRAQYADHRNGHQFAHLQPPRR